MAASLSEKLGIEVKVHLPTHYAAVIEAMRFGHADAAYFSARPYLMAHEAAGAEALVAEVRTNGETFYYSQWYALKDSGIKTLADAKGKTGAFTSPTSTSGYLYPMAKLVKDGHIEKGGKPDDFFSRHVFAGGYEQALRALLAGQADVAAASDYALEKYLTPEERERIVVISRQGPVPSHLIAVRDDLPQNLKDKLRDTLLNMDPKTLKEVYGAEKFKAVTHEEHVAALDEALELTGIPAFDPEQ
jgi:phosphonate transport system substrate-binding protein